MSDMYKCHWCGRDRASNKTVKDEHGHARHACKADREKYGLKVI